MEHHRAECQVEARIDERERLSRRNLESNFDTSPRRLGARSRKHFRRWIGAADRPGRPNDLLCEYCESAGPATYIEHGLTEPYVRKVE
jgi:hypothetical protein